MTGLFNQGFGTGFRTPESLEHEMARRGLPLWPGYVPPRGVDLNTGLWTGAGYGGVPVTSPTSPVGSTTSTGIPYIRTGSTTGGAVLPREPGGMVNPDGTIPGGTSPTGFPVGAYSNPAIMDAISGLFSKGLVPDIARQSAEVSAGRGIAGSPGADSTAVRMSEQNYLQRLGLANTLLSGEAGRNLPYQITPYQQKLLDLQLQALQNRQFGYPLTYGTPRTSNSYYRPSIGSQLSSPSVPPYGGTGFGSGPFGSDLSAYQMMGGGGSYGGSGGYPGTLDDVYDWLGFGNFGSLPGDTTTQLGQYPEPPDFYDEMWD